MIQDVYPVGMLFPFFPRSLMLAFGHSIEETVTHPRQPRVVFTFLGQECMLNYQANLCIS